MLSSASGLSLLKNTTCKWKNRSLLADVDKAADRGT
jgi:hypothetical protein